MVFIQELFGTEETTRPAPNDFPHRVLSAAQKEHFKILPIAASWTPIAAEYVLDQQQFQDPNNPKIWRPFKADGTHVSEDAQWADEDPK